MKAAFVKVPTIYFDSGVVAAVGHRAICVYLLLRRFEWRESHHTRKIEEARKAGYKVSYANQKKVGTLLGIPRQRVCKELKFLAQIRWVYPIVLEGHGRAYKIGRNKKDGKEVDYFFADLKLERVLHALPAECVGWKNAIVEKRIQHIKDLLVAKELST